MDSLVIVAWLVSPVVGDMSLPIDGVLLSLACRRAYGAPPPLLPGERLSFDRELCPLAVVNEGEDWFYAASFAMWGEHLDQAMYWNKRFDVLLAERWTDSKAVNTSQGYYRGYHYRLQARHAATVRWYVRGDQERIVELLEGATHIGKKASMGYGQVQRWAVLPSAVDWSVVGEDGLVTRAVPRSWPGADRLPLRSMVGYRAIRPPYWDVENLRLAYVPGRTF